MTKPKRNTRSAQRYDRLAAVVITVGGVFVIAAIVGIFFEIFGVTIPLFTDAKAKRTAVFQIDPERLPVAAALDSYFETAYVVYADGRLQLHQLQPYRRGKQVPLHFSAPTDATITHAEQVEDYLSLAWSDGSASWLRSRFFTRFDDASNRTVHHQLAEVTRSTAFVTTATPALHRLRFDDGSRTEAAIIAGALVVQRVSESENLFGETTREQATFRKTLPGRPSALLLNRDGSELTVVYPSGALERFRVTQQQLNRIAAPPADGNDIVTVASLLLGDFSVLLGGPNGDVSVWFPVQPDDADHERFRKIHVLPQQTGKITRIRAFPHNKSFVTVDDNGTVAVHHATSERQVLTIRRAPLQELAINQRGNGMLLVDQTGEVTVWAIDNPHPEASFTTLFGKVWYEGYDEPIYAWQSSSASGDFEPKLSLIPLISGTLKATFYAMLFSIPLALLAAIYASQFLNRKLHGVVKPAIELMAAFPSVVVGFLAALWLAPVLEGNMVALALCWITIPLALVLWLMLWHSLEQRFPLLTRKRGIEYAALLPVVALAVAIAIPLATPVEAVLFNGDFNQWLFSELGMRYDQRNAIVIAFGLGFAVVPIIFTISDDALSNVPKSLSAASLAIGASRWQTVWKVVVPSASPGIFAAIMIGLGRAVGETMIVLMAAGNTPLLSWSPFNGMRTLSANIAVEIPEAPHGGTLYRVLFLSALLLFIFTFIANTLAEVVRTRLRQKYGRF